jgi:signal transduction histidine kinase
VYLILGAVGLLLFLLLMLGEGGAGVLAVDTIRLYDTTLSQVKIAFSILAALGLLVLLATYFVTSSISGRRKLLWLICGVGISAGGYIALAIIPEALGVTLMPEEPVILLTVVAPIFFATSIVRDRALDIEIIASRGLVHGITTIAAIAIYMGVVSVVVDRFHLQLSTGIMIPAIVLIDVALFFPARGILQRLVDRVFFRVQYLYREALKSSSLRIKDSLSARELVDALYAILDTTFAPHGLRIHVKDGGTNESIVREEGDVSAPVIRREFAANSGVYRGSIRLGPLRSGQLYTDEDTHLLDNMLLLVEQQLDRFALHRSAELQRAEAERQAELHALKSFFLSGVTHDLKTPLTSIRMFANLLRDQANGHVNQRYFEIIEGEADRLTRLIDQVLDYAKVERGTMQYQQRRCDVVPVVRDAVQVIHYQLSMNGFTVTERFCESAVCNIAPDALMNCVINLLSNSMKYSAADRSIIITIECANGMALISVEDHGIGIPPEHKDKIFQPFTRVHDESATAAGGTGLGLALVRHFVDSHNGSIHVESEVGRGSRFTLSFPLA